MVNVRPMSLLHELGATSKVASSAFLQPIERHCGWWRRLAARCEKATLAGTGEEVPRAGLHGLCRVARLWDGKLAFFCGAKQASSRWVLPPKKKKITGASALNGIEWKLAMFWMFTSTHASACQIENTWHLVYLIWYRPSWKWPLPGKTGEVSMTESSEGIWPASGFQVK